MDKCGEIYRFGPTQFIFSCVYCDGQFVNHRDALDHIEDHFVLEWPKENVSNFNKHDIDNAEFLSIKQEPEFIDLDPTKQGEILTTEENSNYVDSPENSHTSLELEMRKSSKSCTSANEECRKPQKFNVKKNSNQRIWGPKLTVVQCDICKEIIKKHNMLRHCNSHHRIKRFSCPNCKREYKSNYVLQNHMKTHSNIKKYHCDICGWQFHSDANLTKHIRTHTGEKPFKCSYCNKSFAQSSTLVTHTRVHTGEKPFQCSICPKAFVSSSKLRLHLRGHENDRRHNCSLCDMVFLTKAALLYHNRARHTGERPFKCEMCDKAFYKKYSYNQHVILHTDLKPYQCHECDQTFAQNAQRRLHERSIHKNVIDSIANTSKFVTTAYTD